MPHETLPIRWQEPFLRIAPQRCGVRLQHHRWRGRREADLPAAPLRRIDILVNDAAYNKVILTQDVWDKIMAVNLTGPMRLTKAVAPVMTAQDAAALSTSHPWRDSGPTGSSIAYAVSNAGLHLTRCMAVALAPKTLVACVAPGLLEGTRATSNFLRATRPARR